MMLVGEAGKIVFNIHDHHQPQGLGPFYPAPAPLNFLPAISSSASHLHGDLSTSCNSTQFSLSGYREIST
jgi:hypothetical protein